MQKNYLQGINKSIGINYNPRQKLLLLSNLSLNGCLCST